MSFVDAKSNLLTFHFTTLQIRGVGHGLDPSMNSIGLGLGGMTATPLKLAIYCSTVDAVSHKL